MYTYIHTYIHIFFKALILIMCNSLEIVIKNTFSCCADISQPFRYIHIYMHKAMETELSH